MKEIKLNDIRNYINRNNKVSICIGEKTKYNNYSSIEFVPEILDNLYVENIGLIESEVFDEKNGTQEFETHIEIFLSEKIPNKLNKYKNIYKVGSIYATNSFGELDFYQIVNVYDNKVDLIRVGKKRIEEKNHTKYIPARVLDINNFSELYYYFGHCYEKITTTIVDGYKEYIDDIEGMRYVEYNGIIFNSLKLEK